MLKTTRWSPDTCGCILEYECDNEMPVESRVVTYKKTISTCPEHTALVGQALYDQILSENTRKNITFGEIERLLPKVTLDNYLWFFNKNRVLQVSLVEIDFPQAAKQGLQTALDARFGPGMVTVV